MEGGRASTTRLTSHAGRAVDLPYRAMLVQSARLQEATTQREFSFIGKKTPEGTYKTKHAEEGVPLYLEFENTRKHMEQ